MRVFCVCWTCRYRSGRVLFYYRRKWNRIIRLPQVLVFRRWRTTRRYKGRTSVRLGNRYRRISLRRGRFLFRRNRKWRRLSYRPRRGRRLRQRRRRRHRRKLRRYRRKLRRIRRLQRRKRRRQRRTRRYRRRTSPLKVYYGKKTRVIYRWKRRLTLRLGGRRRMIR